MKRIRSDQHALEIELTKQLLEHGALVILACGVAGLSDRHAQSSGVQRHLGDERGTAAAGGLNRTSQGLAITDQLIEIACPTWDLGDGLIPDSSADGSHIHLQEEVAEGGIGGRSPELDTKRLREHSVMTPGKALQITQALALAQDAEHRHQQQIPGRNANPSTHPSIRDRLLLRRSLRLEEADQIEIGCGRSAVGHKEEAIPPTSTHADSPGKKPWDRL